VSVTGQRWPRGHWARLSADRCSRRHVSSAVCWRVHTDRGQHVEDLYHSTVVVWNFTSLHCRCVLSTASCVQVIYIPEHFRDEFLTIKRYTNLRLLYLLALHSSSGRRWRTLTVTAVTVRQPTTTSPVQCPPVIVPPGALVDPAVCSTHLQMVGVKCRLRCVQQRDDHSVETVCSATRQWTLSTDLRCLNDTVHAGLYAASTFSTRVSDICWFFKMNNFLDACCKDNIVAKLQQVTSLYIKIRNVVLFIC